jgi:hypothetical protein
MIDLPTDPQVQVSVTSVDLGTATLAGLDKNHDGIVFTPMRRLENGVGVYSEATLFLVKELRVSGMSATFLDSPEQRTFVVRKGASADLVALAISVGGTLTANTAWFYIERLLSRHSHSGDPNAPDLELVVIDPLAPPASNQLTLRGKSDVVLRAAAEIAQRTPPPGSDGGAPNP